MSIGKKYKQGHRGEGSQVDSVKDALVRVLTPSKSMAKKKKKKEVALTLTQAPLKREQLLRILYRTPKNHIYRRPAKGGGEWEYVTGVYVKKILNYVFGWMWDFEVKEHGREGDLVWVLGRLTIKNRKGESMIIKEQFGRADIKFKRGSKVPLDYGNDLKAAATDALKKCASELGIASDIYGKNEFKEIQMIDKGFVPPEKKEEKKPNGSGEKVKELKKILQGKTDKEKLEDLKKRTGIILNTFEITEKHAKILIASLLNSEVR